MQGVSVYRNLRTRGNVTVTVGAIENIFDDRYRRGRRLGRNRSQRLRGG